MLIIVLGGAIALLGTSSARQQGVGGLSRAVPGISIRAVPAAPVLHNLVSGGEPPSNIVSELTLPAGSRLVTVGGNASPIDQFDRSVTVSVPASVPATARFYRIELSRARWVLDSDGPGPDGGRLLLAEHPGTDGYEWLVGITIHNSSSPVSPALAGSSKTGAASTVQIRLEQNGDAS